MDMDQSAKLRLNQEETSRSGVRQKRSFLLILFNLHSEYPSKEPSEGLGDFKIGGTVICTVKYADLV